MEPKMLKVTITGETREYPKGISYADIVKDFEGTTEAPIILVTVDGKLRELHKRLKKDCTLTFITTKEPIGHKTYRRSACLILLKAIYDVAGRENIEKVIIHYSVGSGFYFTMSGKTALTHEFLGQVKA